MRSVCHMRTDSPNVLAGARLVRSLANVVNLKWRKLPLQNFFLRLLYTSLSGEKSTPVNSPDWRQIFTIVWYRVSERPITETSINKKDDLIETQTWSISQQPLFHITYSVGGQGWFPPWWNWVRMPGFVTFDLNKYMLLNLKCTGSYRL